MAIQLLLRDVLLGLFGSNSSLSSEQDFNQLQNIQCAATRALPDIMSGPDIFQNLDCPVMIHACTIIMTKNYEK